MLTYRELAQRQSYSDKFEVVFHYGKDSKDDTLDEEVKNEIVHLYWDVYHKNGKPYLYDSKKNRYCCFVYIIVTSSHICHAPLESIVKSFQQI